MKSRKKSVYKEMQDLDDENNDSDMNRMLDDGSMHISSPKQASRYDQEPE